MWPQKISWWSLKPNVKRNPVHNHKNAFKHLVHKTNKHLVKAIVDASDVVKTTNVETETR